MNFQKLHFSSFLRPCEELGLYLGKKTPVKGYHYLPDFRVYGENTDNYEELSLLPAYSSPSKGYILN